MASNWDQSLTSLALNNVRIRANSLTEAWKAGSSQYLVRSVLAASDRAFEDKPFEFESATCTLKEFHDALAANYGLDWTQDEQTGVTWFHPEGLACACLLPTKIHVERDQLGLPMHSGILEPLEDSGAAGITVKRWSTLFQNTFDYAVDVPANVYTVREILNLCCVANPTKTFFAQLSDSSAFVTAINLVSDEAPSAPVGALHLWDVKVGHDRDERGPTQEQMMTALADQEPELRQAAREFLEATIWNAPIEEWLRSDTSSTELLWTCIGVTSVLVRSEKATHRASIETMERLATNEFLASCEPGLAVMTALDLARLTKEMRALDVVKNRKFAGDELESVISDACRVTALSADVRKALEEKSADVLLWALEPLAAIVRSRSPGKLAASVVNEK